MVFTVVVVVTNLCILPAIINMRKKLSYELLYVVIINQWLRLLSVLNTKGSSVAGYFSN